LAEGSDDSYSLTRPADGAVGLVTVDSAPVLGIELCLAGLGTPMASRGEMSEPGNTIGNAGRVSSQCFLCIVEVPERRYTTRAW
jgi:hypothetical protein